LFYAQEREPIMRRHLISAVAAAVALLATGAAFAQATPVVQGPEAVADWFSAGKSFIDQGKATTIAVLKT
jgi:hypothetical protein